jgi:hypothetical protein
MIVKSYQTAFNRNEPIKIRHIEIGPLEGLTQAGMLNLAYEQGQNMFQPVEGCYSVSVGDVIELPDGSLHRVASCGFIPVVAGEASLCGEEAQKAARGW